MHTHVEVRGQLVVFSSYRMGPRESDSDPQVGNFTLWTISSVASPMTSFLTRKSLGEEKNKQSLETASGESRKGDSIGQSEVERDVLITCRGP